MYGIKCYGGFIHSVVPDDPLGIALKLSPSGSSDFIKFHFIEDCSALVALLQVHFPDYKIRIVKL